MRKKKHITLRIDGNLNKLIERECNRLINKRSKSRVIRDILEDYFDDNLQLEDLSNGDVLIYYGLGGSYGNKNIVLLEGNEYYLLDVVTRSKYLLKDVDLLDYDRL